MRLRVLLLIILMVGCTKKQVSTNNLLAYLPQNPSLIIKINHLANLKTELNNNPFLQEIKSTQIFSDVSEKLGHIDQFNPNSEALLGFYEEGKNNFEYVLVTKSLEGINNDGLPDFKVETFTYDNENIKKITSEDNVFFLWTINGHQLITSSQLLAENLVRSDFPVKTPPSLQQLYDSSEETKTSTLFFNYKNGQILANSILNTEKEIHLKNFADWSALDFSNEKNNLHLNGVTITNDSTKSFLNLFKGTLASTESIASITPKNIDAFISFRFGDYDTFANNQKQYLDVVREPDTLLNTIEEIGVLISGEKKSVVLKSYGPSNLADHLLTKSSKSEDYQGYEILKLNEVDFLTKQLNPLVKKFSSNFWTIIENYFIISEDQETLKTLIANKNSGTTLNISENYLAMRELLPNESSIFFVSKKGGINDMLEGILSKKINNDIKKAKLDDYAIAGQISVDGNIFHSQLIVDKIGVKRESQNVSPLLNVQLDNDLAIDPQFVKNHRNGRYEIVVQDVDNNLYLINSEGKILWKKQLEGKIRGQINQVDLFKNGKLQMAFCTNNQFIVLDRNGEVTKGIEKKYEGGNLNGLAVFDYENNRNYRMVVTQGRKIFMYNNEGKKVDGFTYTEAESPIINPPKHFRVGNKDFLVFQLENGKLKIRHRAGGNRITADRTIEFSENDVFFYKNKFSITDKKGVLHQVDTRGKLSATNLNLGPNHGMYATSKTLALMDENVLSIKGKKIELDLGIYTKPTIFYIYDKIYVAVTDIQNQKIHLYDSQGMTIPNFPVYGNSAIDLIDVDGDKKLELVAKDQDNSIILYGIN